MTNFEKVGVFMKTFNQDVKDSSSLSTDKINSLRISLINEELEELKQAISEKNLTEVADALTDILYVTYGAGHAFGINLDKCFEEVQKSNMSKLGKDGKPIYNEFGKVMKGPDYFKPDLSKLKLLSSSFSKANGFLLLINNFPKFLFSEVISSLLISPSKTLIANSLLLSLSLSFILAVFSCPT